VTKETKRPRLHNLLAFV